MRKRSLTIVLAWFFIAISCLASTSDNTQVPVDKDLRYGTLANGLTYYIKHNSEPAKRAEFHLAQKVGSMNEEENERGLAHFLEHMAFNGSEHFPNLDMLMYLQNNGMVYGRDINAFTSFDETVYRVTNVNTSRTALLDSVLIVLRDWSCGLTLDDKAIDKERGIIEEEWRSRSGADMRMYEKVLPVLYKGSRYADRMPIGLMSIVKNFKSDQLREYYHKWYRPDLQGLIIVGDFDADSMEQKVIKTFGNIKMPANAPKRIYYDVPDHQGINYALYKDKEASGSSVYIFFQHDVVPKAERNTMGQVRKDVIKSVAQMLLAQRFQELVQNPATPYQYAYCYDDKLYISSTKDAFILIADAKEGKTRESLDALLTEAQRLKLHGFTQSELDRAKISYDAQLQNVLTEKDKHENSAYANEYISHFTDGGYIPGIEYEVKTDREYLKDINLDSINNYIGSSIKENNVSIIISGPDKDSIPYPDETTVKADFGKILASKVDAYVDKTNNAPLLAKLPKKGKITSETYNDATGVTTLKLSNGATVLLKPTTFKNDEIQIDATSVGGQWAYKGKYPIEMRTMSSIIEYSALGGFTQNDLIKKLADKNISLNFDLNDPTEQFTGASVKKDLETLFQLTYMYFTDVRKDPEAFNALKSRLKSTASQARNNPEMILSDSIQQTLYKRNPLYKTMTTAEIDKINYDKVLKLYRERVANAGDYTFSLVGNFNVDSIKPYIEQYIASLPDKGVREKTTYVAPMAKGNVSNRFKMPMGTPKTTVYVALIGDKKYTVRDEFIMNLLSQVMNIAYMMTMREKESGTYGVASQGTVYRYNNKWMFIYEFSTNAQEQDKLMKIASDELKKMLDNGTTDEVFTKIISQTKIERENNLRDNSYWLTILRNLGLGVDVYTGFDKMINDLTLDQFNAYIHELKANDRIEIIMEGVPANNK